MTRCLLLAFALAALACSPNAPPSDLPGNSPAAALTTFGSEEAFVRYQQRMVREWEARTRKRPILGSYPRTPEPPPMDTPVPAGEPVEAQAAGVHEAGIVKATRDHLVILRRNRLHTVRIAGGALDTVASVDAFAPGTPEHERSVRGILVSGDVVAAIGTGARGLAVQAALFRVDAAGGLTYQGTYQVRSDGDEEHTPIMRLVDGKLVVFAPVGVWPGDPRGIAPYLPAVRRWEPASADTAWTPLTEPARIYRPATVMRADDGVTFHALTVCDPAGGTLDCRATVVYAPRNLALHVSRTAAYVWTLQRQGYDEEGRVPDRSILYRIPLDGGAATALGVHSRPHDALSFDETADGQLHVLVSSGRLPPDRVPRGSAWLSVALLRVPLSAFGDGSGAAGDDAYRPLPNPGSTTLRNRFAGDWVLYGTERENGAYGTWEEGMAFAARRDGTGEAVPLPLPGGLIGIDAMGTGALVTTSTSDGLRHQPLWLGAQVEPRPPLTRAAAHPWEVEAHAVFYDGDADVLGVARSGFVYTPSVLFLRRDGSGLRAVGELGATVPPGTECPQCGGYYEFARPVFLRGRILAIVGGEVVEGVMDGDRIRELRRVRIGPPALSR